MRYVTKPRLAQWYPPLNDCGDVSINSGTPQTVTVHEDARNSWTVLYDANGNEIHRPPNKVGF